MQSKLSALVLASAVMAAALTSIPAMASVSGATTVNVPFSFTVKGNTLPAGQYRVQRDSSGSFLTLQGKNGGKSFVWVANVAAGSDNRVVLRFADDGQMHALESIQFGPMVTPRLARHTGKSEDITPQYIPGQ